MDEKTWKLKRKLDSQHQEKEDTEVKVKKSLKLSIIEGGFASAMVGFGESFFSAFAIFLKASNFQISLIGSLPRAMGSFVQLYSHKMLEVFKSRKKLIAFFVFLQALMYLPIALVFFFGSFSVPLLLVFLCFYYIFGMMVGPAWSSWMGELVSSDIRGAYFSKRNTIAGFVSFTSVLIAGYLLQYFKTGDDRFQFWGFLIIFMLALIFRLVSFSMFLKKYEPEYVSQGQDDPGFLDFLKNAGSRNYGVYILFLCFLNFSVFIAGPFFAAYMLYDLKLNYIQYTLVTSSAVIARLISLRIWGKMADRYGTRKVMTLAAFFIPMISIWWLFSGNIYYLIVIEMYSGFAWAGFELASFNFLLETITPNKRAKYIAYYNVLNGGALLFGALLGGLLIKYNQIFWSKYLLVFLVSVIFVPKLKEVRRVEEDITYPRLLFSIFSTMRTEGLAYDVITFRPLRENLKGPLKKIKDKSIERLRELPDDLKGLSDDLKGLPEEAMKIPRKITKKIMDRPAKIKVKSGVNIMPRKREVVKQENIKNEKTPVKKK